MKRKFTISPFLEVLKMRNKEKLFPPFTSDGDTMAVLPWTVELDTAQLIKSYSENIKTFFFINTLNHT